MTLEFDKFFAKRYLIHLFMILLALVAVVPIYILLINATRSVEQLNLGISIFPGGYTDILEPVIEFGPDGKPMLDADGKPVMLKEIGPDGELVLGSDGKPVTVTIKKRIPQVMYNWRALTNRGFQIWQGFGNSAFIALATTILSVYFSAMTAYGLHAYRFKGRKAIWTLILIIMMLPGSLSIIGFYQFIIKIGLLNNFIPLIIPSIAAAVTVLFIRQYMSSALSMELVDSARVDGANEYLTFNVIILPIIVPALAVQAIFTFVGSWNNYLMPMLLLGSNEKMFTLPMLVAALRGDIYRTEMGGIYLGIAVSLVPIMIFYAFMSRFIISGLTLGGIKE